MWSWFVQDSGSKCRNESYGEQSSDRIDNNVVSHPINEDRDEDQCEYREGPIHPRHIVLRQRESPKENKEDTTEHYESYVEKKS